MAAIKKEMKDYSDKKTIEVHKEIEDAGGWDKYKLRFKMFQK